METGWGGEGDKSKQWWQGGEEIKEVTLEGIKREPSPICSRGEENRAKKKRKEGRIFFLEKFETDMEAR